MRPCKMEKQPDGSWIATLDTVHWRGTFTECVAWLQMNGEEV